MADGERQLVHTCTIRPIALERKYEAGTASIVVGCGKGLLRLQDGVVTEEWETTGPFEDGTVFEDEGSSYDFVVSHDDGSFERLATGIPVRRAHPLPLAVSPESLDPVWEEGPNVCGFAKRTNKTLCRIQGIWQNRDLGLGSVVDVRFIHGSWWALGRSNGKRSIFQRTDKWVKQFEWNETGKEVSDSDFFFVPKEPDGFAVGLGDGRYAVYDGKEFVDAYFRKKSKTFSKPVISSDGLLYDSCEKPGDPEEAVLCIVSRDGDIKFFESHSLESYFFHPLKRGVFSREYIFRGYNSIDADRLYGEFGKEYTLDTTELGNGTLLIKQQSHKPPYRSQFFTYDGESFQLTSTTPSRDSAPLLNSWTNIVWQGQDGLWRAAQKNSIDPIGYWKTAVDAAAKERLVAPDYVHDATKLGDQTLMATNDGIWSCSAASGTRVSAQTTAIPQSPGCKRVRELPLVERILPLPGHGILVEQAGRIVHLDSLEGGAMTVLAARDSQLLGSGGNEAVWIEGQRLHSYSAESGEINDEAIPPGITKIQAVASRWICGKDALFHKNSAGDWERASLPIACLGLSAHDDTAFVVDDKKLFRCMGGDCEVLANLPKNFSPNGALGTWATGNGHWVPMLALGNKLYEWAEDSKTFLDRTPRYSFGSALLTPALRINDSGTLSLDGGGVLTFEKDADGYQVQHIHIDCS